MYGVYVAQTVAPTPSSQIVFDENYSQKPSTPHQPLQTSLLRVMKLTLKLLPLIFVLRTAPSKGANTDDFLRDMIEFKRLSNGQSQSNDYLLTEESPNDFPRGSIESEVYEKSSSEEYLETGLSVSGRRLATVKVSLGIKFDKYPDETSWDLKTEDGTQTVAFGGPYEAMERNGKLLLPITLNQGQKYKLTMRDARGDGMLADYGYFYMLVGTALEDDRSNLIFKENQFITGDELVRVFTAAMPVTSAPTIAPPTVSPAPTSTPTSCTPGGGQRGINSEAFDPKPLLGSPATTFVTDGLCTRHKDYASCTNEVGEDCQWIFLTSAASKGMCRVDPISKCLQTGDCVCYTEDFLGGTSEYGDGIIFHAPINISPRDISEHSSKVTYKETYTQPTAAEQDSRHPLDPTFFVSKVDFTARQLKYTFGSTSPVLFSVETHTVAFKLHYLYMDTPLKGRIWTGLGLQIDIDTSGDTQILKVNSVSYTLPRIQKWTCTQIVIDSDGIFVRGIGMIRERWHEIAPTTSDTLTLGKFSGQLFDVRVYSGTLTYAEIREVGARCTGPDDPASLLATRDIDVLWIREGCESRHNLYFPNPTQGGHTYGSGPFSIFWVRPKQDDLDPDVWLDQSEGMFDEEHYFQQQKFQEYIWEKYYFETDMMAFNLKPYRYFESADHIPEFARDLYNNPCRFMHQSNNMWAFPVFEGGTGAYVQKWIPPTPAPSSKDATPVFDLARILRGNYFDGWVYWAHEAFHEFQGNLWEAMGSDVTKWLIESTASFGPGNAFPGMNDNIYAGFSIAPEYPLALHNTEPGTQFCDPDFSDCGAGGMIYGSWIFFWFLAQFAEMPGLIGQLCSLERPYGGRQHGLLALLRILVEARGVDLGDAWGIFIAHHRTWDVGEMEVQMSKREAEDIDAAVATQSLKQSNDAWKTTVELNPSIGTQRKLVSGPVDKRPGPFSRNCLTARGVMQNRFVAITIRWDDGMGFPATTVPSTMKRQQKGCDDDNRFYSSMIVVHNEQTGERSYYKVKGKRPPRVWIHTGTSGPVTIHVLLLPTPPTDYVQSTMRADNSDDFIQTTIPAYSYKYAVSIRRRLPTNAVLTPMAQKREDGIVNFETITSTGYWDVKCSCAYPLSSGICVSPTFERTLMQPSRTSFWDR